MRDFQDLSWSEGAEAVLALLPRLTVMRGINDSEPVRELDKCCSSLIEGDVRAASEACFRMTSALLRGPARRVTGELFCDFLLHKLLLEPNPFSRMAAANRLDEAVYNAMKEDLDVLCNLRGLTGEILYRFVQERYEELRRRNRPNRDSATRIAEAAWGGNAVRQVPEEAPAPMPKLPAFLPNGAPNWHYGEEELREPYVSDEALEEMYHRFLSSGQDWPFMVEDLWNFFAAYGTGIFLKERLFVWNCGKLVPMPEPRLASYEPLLGEEYRACLAHAIEFMRGDGAEPMLILGAEGMGKTAMLFALADELPEMRFIYAPECRSFSELLPLFEGLRDQPLKFMVAADDADLRGVAARVVPVNVLLTATTSANSPSCRCFTKRVVLPQLRLDSFADMVCRLLDSEGASLPREVVRSACVDHQVDSKGELTVCAAVALAEKLRSAEAD
ncbi:MAG: DUF815 domain-containing protein [Clostridia bacterium]|nr:DUF815 domain-containing protein [Clostridia bacterium]